MSNALTVGAVIANVTRACPHEVAAVIDGVPYTFADVDGAGTRVAQQLVAHGFSPGDVALVFAPTSFSLLAHHVGCARAGIVFAPINPSLDASTIADVVERIRPAVLLAAPEFTALAAGIDLPTMWCDIDEDPADVVLPAIDGSDPHIAFFTSGSTGLPKAALVSHRTSVLRSHPGSQLEPRGPALCPYPMFHMAGWTITLQQWHARGSVVFVEGTDAETLSSAIRHHGIERFNAIPALWSRIGDHLLGRPGREQTLPTLRFADTGTSPTSVELLDTIASLAPNAHVRVFYGSSEAGNVAMLHHADLRTRPGSCGQPSVLTEVSLADDGELLVRGSLLFDRYLGDPVATEASLRDGWYHTGDRAEVDDDGYLSIIGRTGTVIRSGGEAIVPESVEAALRTHPAVDAVAVFGLADENWGELVCAAVVASAPLTLADLRRHVSPSGPSPLARHQHPRRLLLLDAIPRTAATGQVDRLRLRRLAEASPTEASAP